MSIIFLIIQFDLANEGLKKVKIDMTNITNYKYLSWDLAVSQSWNLRMQHSDVVAHIT